ncbi:diacylglycerol kinase family protein [Agrococcus sp. SL85]|uniref:diacylglycerol/lipid kinase family protein n=1 Tax=Agrococcus sp. SL85 TaxID=2995141 RepID=UPI00226C71D5|nr:diacylglycerol kinase family protein [Agrococcus sp. SL85]WAC65412.1 diacylglycerol kinase family protein [Agrococcus sp. SL85]
MLVVVASNPAARFGRSGGVGAVVEARIRALGHEVVHIAASGYAAQLEQTRFAMIRADVLVVVGGDGMVHLGVNVVGGTSKPMLVVPAGSGNDFAAALGVRDAQDALDRMPATLAAAPERVDLVRIEHPDGVALAAGIVSVGFDSDVTVRSLRMRRVPSSVRYEAAILATLVRLRHRTFRVRIDGGAERTWRTAIAAVANNRTLGGGIPLAASASMRDGLLTAVLADELRLPAFLRLLGKAMRGTHQEDPRVTTVDCEVVELDCDEPVSVCADGEVVGRLPIRCSTMPGALQVLRPV